MLLNKPKSVIDIQKPKSSVYKKLPIRVNLGFNHSKRLPFLNIAKFLTIFGILAFLLLGRTSAPTSATLAVDAQSEAERQALEARLKALEAEMDEYQKQIEGYQKQGSSLKSEINRINAKMAQLSLEIKSVDYSLVQLNNKIKDTEKEIVNTEASIDSQRKNLSNVLRTLYSAERTNLVEIFLKSQNFSEFFGDLNSLNQLQASVQESIQKIAELKDVLEDEKERLTISKADVQTVKEFKAAQKLEADKVKDEKNQLLAVTKGQESKYQEILKEKKKTAAELRSRIFQLLGGGEMTFGDAYKLAKMAGDATGVRPALILAILDRESALGQNVGKCTYITAPMNNKKIKRPSGVYKSEVDYFLEITSDLGFTNPESVSVSCHNADGAYGGAMGPAQFMPSTWAGYMARISSITGKSASPWNNADAFVAAGLYLKDAGATTSERTAAAKYYCGGNWNRYVCTNVYAKKVLDQATNFEDDIATLNQ